MSKQLSSEVYALLPSTDTTSWNFHLVDSFTLLRQLLRSTGMLKIAFHFDPFSDKAAEELKEVCLIANEARVEVYTYSTSHLEWLENLTVQLGASQHCSNLADIQAVANAH